MPGLMISCILVALGARYKVSSGGQIIGVMISKWASHERHDDFDSETGTTLKHDLTFI
jgi:hypothetical protein